MFMDVFGHRWATEDEAAAVDENRAAIAIRDVAYPKLKGMVPCCAQCVHWDDGQALGADGVCAMDGEIRARSTPCAVARFAVDFRSFPEQYPAHPTHSVDGTGKLLREGLERALAGEGTMHVMTTDGRIVTVGTPKPDASLEAAPDADA